MSRFQCRISSERVRPLFLIVGAKQSEKPRAETLRLGLTFH